MEKVAKIGITEHGMYWGEIRDEHGDVEAATLQDTPFEVHKWAFDHGCDDIVMSD